MSRVAGIAEGGFLHVKGVVETLYRGAQGRAGVRPRRSTRCSIRARRRRTAAGVLGELHPRELEGEWGVFELDLERLFAAVGGPVTYRDVITYPAVRQDIAVSVAGGRAGRRPRRRGARGGRRRAAGDPRLRRLPRRPGRPGRKSVAFSVAYQSAERTLTDEDAARLRNAVVSALAERFGAELRGQA